MRRGLPGEVYVIMAASLWGTYGVAYKLGVKAGCDQWMLIALRPLLATVFLTPIVFLSRERVLGKWSITVGLAGLAPLYITYPLAVERVGVGLAAVLLYTAPLWVTLASPLYGEYPGLRVVFGSILGFAGVLLIFKSGVTMTTDYVGLILGLLAGLSYALYIILARVAKRRGASTREASIGAIFIASIPVLIASRISRLPEQLELLYGSYLAVGATIIPYLLHVHGLGRMSASRASILSLVEPVIAVILGIVLFGEKLYLTTGIGAMLILVSGFLVVNTWDDSKINSRRGASQ